MILFKDLINDIINYLKYYFSYDFTEFEKYYILKQVEKCGHYAIKQLRKNKNLQYLYIEKLVICKAIIEYSFGLEQLVFFYNVNLQYHTFILKTFINEVIDYIVYNPHNKFYTNDSFYKYIENIMYKNSNNLEQYTTKNKILSKNLFFKIEYLFNRKLGKIYNINEDKKITDTIVLAVGDDIFKIKQHIKNINTAIKFEKISDHVLSILGFILPDIRLTGEDYQKDNEYEIRIHNQIVSKGTFQYDSEESINDMFNHLETVLLDNVHKILSVRDTYRYLEYVKKEYSKKIVKQLLKELDINDIKIILCNLIKDRISITNIAFIVESLANFARLDKDVDSLTQKLKGILN